MKSGLEDKKKVGALTGLMLVAGYFFYANVLATGPTTYTPPPAAAGTGATPAPAAASAAAAPAPAAQSTQPRPLITSRTRTEEFHPVLRPRNRQGESTIDPNTVDPTIHIELLAKVQDVKVEGGQRNLFQFGAAAPAELPKGPEPVVKVARVYDYPREAPKPVPPPPVVEPPPTPPSFKYYGLATKKIDNKQTAFFLDGEDIILATEGMTVKSRWRVVRINADSVMLEDTQNRKQQALRISEDAGGSGNS